MRSRKLLAFILCLVTGPALAGYMTLLGAGLGAIQPAAQATFTNSSYSTNLSNLTSIATFSRAGNAMQFDSSGYLTYGPNNLLTYSNTFSNAAWGTITATVTSGVTDPLDGTSAFTVTANGANSQLYYTFASTAPAGANAITSFWIRRRAGTGAISFYDMTGSYTAVTGSVTGSWTQVFVKKTIATGTVYAGLLLATSGDAVDIYAATVSAVTYETTPRSVDQVITTSAAYYGPRFDYTYNGSSWVPAGLLVEGAATNLLLNSKADGTNLSTQSVATTAQAYTLSFYGTGTVTLSGTSTAGPAVGAASPARTTLMFTPTAGSLTLTVTGTVQYAQLETGSTASSFIPTGASTVTRAAETVQLTGTALSTLQGASGTAIVQTTDYPGGSATGILIGGDNNTAYPLAYSSNQGRTYNGFTGMSTANPATLTSPARVGVAWSAAGRSLSLNGGAVATDAGGFWSAQTAFYLGSYAVLAGFSNNHFASLALYNSRLPDATLQTKSVVGAAY